MKDKVWLLFTLIACSLLGYAQLPLKGGNEGLSGFLTTTLDETIQKKDLFINSNDLSRVFDATTGFGEVNVFFHETANENIRNEYSSFFNEPASGNWFRKISDSLYEIHISDPSKMVLFGTGTLKEGFAVGMSGSNLGGLNGPNLMGQTIDSLIVQADKSVEKYKVWSFNPFIYGFEFFVWDKKKNTQALTFKVLLQFPKPKLLAVSTDSSDIRKKKSNPSFVWYANKNDRKDKRQKIELKASQNSVLFAFEHFGNYSRFGYPDNLHYRLDNAKDWSLTSLSQTPTIFLENLPLGKHTLYVKYPAEVAAVFRYEIEVIPSVWDSPILYILCSIVFSSIVFYLFYRMRLKKAKEKANRTKLELQAIHAQLNPHFIFNALGSIQYLINRDDKANADHYLTELSKLLRHSLNNSDKELVPLSVELNVLDSYVRLEQMRFHFQYSLIVDEQIQPDSLSIPPMLVQPLVENAIKHGISGIGTSGILNIIIQPQGDDLEIMIRDNGRGFDQSKPATGLGIKLIKSRIKVLEDQGHFIALTYCTGPEKGTRAVVQFKNWM